CIVLFSCTETAPTDTYTLSLHDALPIFAVPALRMRMLDSFTSNLEMLAGAVAARTGRASGELEVRAFAGAVTGALIAAIFAWVEDRKSTRLNSSHVAISYAVFCLKKKKY